MKLIYIDDSTNSSFNTELIYSGEYLKKKH